MKISRDINSVFDKNDLTTVREEYPEHSFFYINYTIHPDNDIHLAIKSLSVYLSDAGLQVLIGFAFDFEPGAIDELSCEHPGIIFLNHNASTVYRMQLICNESRSVKSVRIQDSAIINTVSHYDCLLFFISSIQPSELGDCYSQAYSSFRTLGRIMKDYAISYNNLARTWLYLRNILNWYDDFNRARTEFFIEENILEGLIPASTGIGIDNIDNKCLSVSAFAIRPEDGEGKVRMIESPMQDEAIKYRSSFSRAVEISFKTSKRLFISGTASINEEGKTLYYNSVADQIEHTMKVVEAILVREQYHWENVVRAIAYFPDIENVRYFDDCCTARGIETSHILIVGGTVCRDDLLFEIELDAVKSL